MILGIFGDSYAAIRHASSQKFGWPGLISEVYPTVNFSLTGSNFFYSYQKILKKFSFFDQCVLILTNPSRISLNDSINIHTSLKFAHNIRPKEDFKKVFNSMSIDALSSTDYFYKYIYDYDFMHEVQHCMVERLLAKIPNLLIIPGFQNSYNSHPFEINTTSLSLYDISITEQNHWNMEGKPVKSIDGRECHLSIENNIILKDIILENLGKGLIELDITRFNLTPEYKEWYYDDN